MSPSYELTEENIAAQLKEIRATLSRITAGLDARQMNWQSDGRRWSIGQCLDHLTKSAEVYSRAIEDAMAKAGPPDGRTARPNLLGRAFLWSLEPPPRIKSSAAPMVQPASTFEPAVVIGAFEESLASVQVLASRAARVDSRRTRFANPFAGGRRVFNIATGVMVLLTHARRHLFQAEQVRARPDFPSA